VRREACSLLAQLDSRAATPYLVETLSSQDPDLARCAWLTLRAWTGLDHPLGSVEWADLLEHERTSE